MQGCSGPAGERNATLDLLPYFSMAIPDYGRKA